MTYPEKSAFQNSDQSGSEETILHADPSQNYAGQCFRYIGDYEIIDEIGRGGMGIVYRAKQLSLNRIVALKVIRLIGAQDKSDRDRFNFEASAAAILDHPNIVKVFEIGEHESIPFFSMQFIKGKTLSQVFSEGEIRNNSPAGLVTIAQIVKTIAEAVHHAHLHGIIHRDLKPSNVLVDENLNAFVADFGLAKHALSDSGFTLSGSIIGTPAYMSPEQCTGDRSLSLTSDVYSLGAILYFLLCGRPPHQSDSLLETIRMVKEEPYEPVFKRNSSIERDLAIICHKCLEKESQHRYQSTAALAEDLAHWINGDPIAARPPGGIERVLRWSLKNRSLAKMLLVFTIGICLFLSTSAIIRSNSQVLAEKYKQSQYAKSLQLAYDLIRRDSFDAAHSTIALEASSKPNLLHHWELCYLYGLLPETYQSGGLGEYSHHEAKLSGLATAIAANRRRLLAVAYATQHAPQHFGIEFYDSACQKKDSLDLFSVPIEALAWSGDGTQIAALAKDGSIAIVSINDHQVLARTQAYVLDKLPNGKQSFKIWWSPSQDIIVTEMRHIQSESDAQNRTSTNGRNEDNHVASHSYLKFFDASTITHLMSIDQENIAGLGWKSSPQEFAIRAPATISPLYSSLTESSVKSESLYQLHYWDPKSKTSRRSRSVYNDASDSMYLDYESGLLYVLNNYGLFRRRLDSDRPAEVIASSHTISLREGFRLLKDQSRLATITQHNQLEIIDVHTLQTLLILADLYPSHFDTCDELLWCTEGDRVVCCRGSSNIPLDLKEEQLQLGISWQCFRHSLGISLLLSCLTVIPWRLTRGWAKRAASNRCRLAAMGASVVLATWLLSDGIQRDDRVLKFHFDFFILPPTPFMPILVYFLMVCTWAEVVARCVTKQYGSLSAAAAMLFLVFTGTRLIINWPGIVRDSFINIEPLIVLIFFCLLCFYFYYAEVFYRPKAYSVNQMPVLANLPLWIQVVAKTYLLLPNNLVNQRRYFLVSMVSDLSCLLFLMMLAADLFLLPTSYCLQTFAYFFEVLQVVTGNVLASAAVLIMFGIVGCCLRIYVDFRLLSLACR